MMKFLIFCLIFFLAGFSLMADNLKRLQKKANQASSEFAQKASVGTAYKFKPDTVVVDSQLKKINLSMKEAFSYIPFRPENTTQ